MMNRKRSKNRRRLRCSISLQINYYRSLRLLQERRRTTEAPFNTKIYKKQVQTIIIHCYLT